MEQPDAMQQSESNVGSTGGARKTRSSRVLLRALLVVVIAGAGFLVWRQYFETYHLATVQQGVLYRDGVQSIREFETAIKRVKPKTVVSLIDDSEIDHPRKPQFRKEQQLLAEAGIRLERIPVKLGGWPERQDVQKFLEIVSKPENQPVLVHCAQGVRRTGMMVAAYQEAMLGYNDQQAKDAILAFGHSERTVKDVKKFIEEYDPKTGDVPAGLASSRE